MPMNSAAVPKRSPPYAEQYPELVFQQCTTTHIGVCFFRISEAAIVGWFEGNSKPFMNSPLTSERKEGGRRLARGAVLWPRPLQ